MTIDVFINGLRADIGDKDEFARNFRKTLQFSDLENPAKIVTDYSYDITLPGTDQNRRIFGWIESGTDPGNFNPNAASPYIVNVNGYVYSEGNMQLTEVTSKSGRIEFKCSFYSKIHGMIMDMSSTPVRELSLFKEYDGWKHYLTASLVDRIWMGADNIADMIRYVPCRAGKYPNFQSSKMMTPVYDANEPPTLTGYEATDLGSDYDEYAMREYRVQYQRPAVSVHNIMRGLVTDFGITFDSSLMASPYVSNSWMMCPQMSQQDESEDALGTLSSNLTLQGTIKAPSSHNPEIDYDCYAPGMNLHGMVQTSTLSSGETIFSGTHITPGDNPLVFSIEFCVKANLATPNVYQGSGNVGTLYTENVDGSAGKRWPAFMSISMNGGGYSLTPEEGAEVKFEQKSGSCWKTSDPPDNNHFDYWNAHIGIDGWTNCRLTPVKFTYTLEQGMHNVQFSSNISFYDWPGYLRAGGGGENAVMYRTDSIDFTIYPMEALSNEEISKLQAAGFTGHTLSYTVKTAGRSPMYVNMDNVFGSTELSCKDFLTDITKMLGCIWNFDSSGNLNISTRNNFFSGYQIHDWTEKLDRSSVSYKPLVFNKRKYTMGYKAGDSLLENNFKDQVGLDYGKQYIDTGYAFNDDTESMLETKFLNTVQCKGQRRILYQDYNNKLKYLDEEPYNVPMIEKKDNGAPNEGFRLLFNNATTELPKGQFVYLSQDAPHMYIGDDLGGKCWMNLKYAYDSSATEIHDNIVGTNHVPEFSTKSNYFYASWDFAKPQISYAGETDLSYDPNCCLYPRFWANYIGSLYDAKVRVMTAKFWLDTDDLIKFTFKDFVVIDNHIWHVNKLIDFDCSGENLTQAELVEVTDIEAWVNGQNWNFSVTPRRDNGDSSNNIGE